MPDRLTQQRIMGAAEHEGINPISDQWIQVLPNDAIGDLTLQPAFLDQWNKKRTGASGNPDGGIELQDGALVGPALDRRAGPDHADVAIASRHNRGLCARLD